jgi:quinol-cytochrome oxidoreductase complex cytochrome b subunit
MAVDRAWLVFILLALGAYFLVAACVVKTFRYRYGGYKVPRLLGGVVYALVGSFLAWMGIAVALKP